MSGINISSMVIIVILVVLGISTQVAMASSSPSSPILAFVSPTTSNSRNAIQQHQQQLYMVSTDITTTPPTTNTTPSPPQPPNAYGMPWHTSIAPYSPPPNHSTLLFMPYWTHTVSLLQQQLTNLLPIHDLKEEHAYASAESGFVPSPAAAAKAAANAKKGIHQPPTSAAAHTQIRKKSRITSASYTSDEYRKIRMFYYDGGDAIQAYNSLWYPDPKLGNRPLLGMDLLAFDRKTYLVIIDFQPLPGDIEELLPVTTSTGVDEEVLAKLRKEWSQGQQEGAKQAQLLHQQLPSVLQGKMSGRFFDETEFFSNHMLFGRFTTERESLLYPPLDGVTSEDAGEVFESFRAYLQTHIDMVQSPSPSTTTNNNNGLGNAENTQLQELMERAVLEGQKQYDVYSASCDPALAMFGRVFGEEWADGYIHDYMFDLSTGGGSGVGAGGGGVTKTP